VIEISVIEISDCSVMTQYRIYLYSMFLCESFLKHYVIKKINKVFKNNVIEIKLADDKKR